MFGTTLIPIALIVGISSAVKMGTALWTILSRVRKVAVVHSQTESLHAPNAIPTRAIKIGRSFYDRNAAQMTRSSLSVMNASWSTKGYEASLFQS